MDETSNRIRAVIVSLAIALMLLGASCASSTAAQPVPTTTEAPTTTTTTAPLLDLSWLNTTTTTIAPTVPAPQPVPEVVQDTSPADGCYIDLARSIGWPDHTLGTLAHIIQRESNCNPTSYADRPSTMDDSRGLLQINAFGSLRSALMSLCGLSDLDQLFDPAVNLTCGLTYYNNMGFRPWGQ